MNNKIDYRKMATELVENVSNLQKQVLIKHTEAILEELHERVERYKDDYEVSDYVDIGYICPVCEETHIGLPKMQFKGPGIGIIFTCRVTGEDWENTRDHLDLNLIRKPDDNKGDGDDLQNH